MAQLDERPRDLAALALQLLEHGADAGLQQADLLGGALLLPHPHCADLPAGLAVARLGQDDRGELVGLARELGLGLLVKPLRLPDGECRGGRGGRPAREIV